MRFEESFLFLSCQYWEYKERSANIADGADMEIMELPAIALARLKEKPGKKYPRKYGQNKDSQA